LVLEGVAHLAAGRQGSEVDLVEAGGRKLDQAELRRRRQGLVEARGDQHLGGGKGFGVRLGAGLVDPQLVAEALPQIGGAAFGDGAVEENVHRVICSAFSGPIRP
jgi:hypothetical protein